MSLSSLLAKLYQEPESLVFADVLATIDEEFEFTPSAFANGVIHNQASENQGSCKVLAFANQAGLSQVHALNLFAEHYRDGLANPSGDSHQNIRQFMERGWQGVSFERPPLKKK